MKEPIIALFLAIIAAYIYSHMLPNSQSASAGNVSSHKQIEQTASFRQVEPSLVCMINNAYFGKKQIPVKIGDKTYYGCCANCETTLKQDPSSRIAVDPVSGNEVDKATAIIGADKDDNAYYFENLDNLNKFKQDKAM